jgi:glutathione peroxidase
MNLFRWLISRCRHRNYLWLWVLLFVPACHAAESVYDYSLVQMDGKEISLSSYKGKVLLFVNLARKSSFDNQFASLDKLYQTYKEKGLVVIGVPSNDFGAEEPGTDAEVNKAYTDLHPGFLVVARVSVRGKDEAPLYTFLTGSKDKELKGDVHWNFTKFIVDRTGQVAARFSPDVEPTDPALEMTLEKVLAGTYKKSDKPKVEEPPAKSDDDDDDDD